MEQPNIVVVGSINMDLVTQAPRIPTRGETIIGTQFSTFPGGKGANQAIALARLGANVTMIGCVGEDVYGKQLLQHFQSEGVHCESVKISTNSSTGTASIMMDQEDNCIVVIPGANHELSPEDLLAREDTIKNAQMVILQLEIPLPTVETTIGLANKHRVPVILNPAPAIQLSEKLLEAIDIVTPNEHELTLMLGAKQDDDFRTLLNSIPNQVVMTHGGNGAYFKSGGGDVRHQQGFKVEVCDTTGAGDTFNGALAYQISIGASIEDAVYFAVAASALSVTKLGSQSGMPTMSEVKNFLEKKERES